MASIHRQLIINKLEREIIRNAISIETFTNCRADNEEVLHGLSQDALDRAFAIGQLRARDAREAELAVQ